MMDDIVQRLQEMALVGTAYEDLPLLAKAAAEIDRLRALLEEQNGAMNIRSIQTERLRAELEESKEIERATHNNEIDLQIEVERLRAENERLKVPLCIGKSIISILARDGAWSSEDGRAVLAADELFRADPYTENERLRALIAEQLRGGSASIDWDERATAALATDGK